MIEDHELLIVIQDDGVGVADTQKEIIFTKGIGSSSHFGLFFTREILSITGITITETGKAGEGAVFQIRVPKQGYRIIGGCTGSTPV